MPCNFHLRALAAKVKEGIRAAGGTPMEFNTIAISDGITMGTSGMKTSPRQPRGDRRLDRARRPRPPLRRASSRSRACDKTIPGTVMALARLDVPGLMLYGGSIPPGHYKGKDVTIMDVFEAVGAHAAGKITDEELHRARGRRQPRRRRLRRPVHRQHDGDGLRDARHLADRARATSRRRTRRKAEVAYDGRRAGHGRARPRPAAERHHHPRRRSRTRSPASRRAAAPPTASCTCSPSPARRASTARHRRLRPHRRPGRRCCATSSPAGASSPPTCTPPAAPPSSPRACSRPACCTRTRRP